MKKIILFLFDKAFYINSFCIAQIFEPVNELNEIFRKEKFHSDNTWHFLSIMVSIQITIRPMSSQ
jgi:hypothetical protein